MVKVENYAKAYKEVYEILKNTDKEDFKLIPEEFIKMLEENMDNTYEFEMDYSVSFEKQKLLTETKSIFAYIFLNYWGTENQKQIINQKFKQDIMISEQKKKEKYNNKELFSDKILEKSSENKEKILVEYKKENVLIKFLNKIKSLVRRKNK